MIRISAVFSAFLLVAALWIASPALAAQTGGGFTGAAQPQGKGGFTGPGPAVVTVKQALEMRDDAKVTLRGNIVQHLGGDKYLFKDATGTVKVEIDDDEWGGQSVGPDDTVELYGEVDKDWNSVEIDVDRLVRQ